jgi:aerobic carbon-monoxide dehydrogenase medium subunit
VLPARFDYHRPSTLADALSLLDEHGEDAKVLAGGMSLIPLMKLRFAAPANLVDINDLPDMDAISESDGWLRIGSLVRHHDVEQSDVIYQRYPTLAAAAPLISDPLIRNRGTVAGSLAHADPAGDWGSVMLAVGAQVAVKSSSGERVLPIDEFLVDTFTSALAPNEIVAEVRVPAPAGRGGGAYLKMERKVGDFATVAVAISLTMDEGHISRAGIGLTAVGPKNIRAGDAEASLAGAEPTDAAFAEAGRLAAAAADPQTDVRGSADYKRNVVSVFVQRGLAQAAASAASAN